MTRGPLVGFASPASGCLYYRALVPALMLRGRGYRVVATDDLIIGTDGGFAFPAGDNCPSECEPDVVVLAGGWPSDQAHHFIRRTRATGQRVIVDCDDWPEPPAENPYATEHALRDHLAAMLEAHSVTTSTQYLRDALAARGIGAFLARNIIDPATFRWARRQNELREERRDAGEELELRAGVRGMLCGFHDADVLELAGKLPPGPRYVHIGYDPRGVTFETLTGTPAEGVPARPFFDGYPELLAGIDVGLIPFARRPFSMAKSAIAGLEWSAAGVPWVASHHPEFRRLDSLATMAAAGSWKHRLRTLSDPLARAVWRERQTKALDGYTLEAATCAGTPAFGAADAWEQAIRHALL